MPPEGSSRTAALPWLITLPASLLALVYVIFIIVPGCTGGAARNGGTWGCGNMPVVYLCSALFLGAAAYSGYQLVRIVLAGRAG